MNRIRSISSFFLCMRNLNIYIWQLSNLLSPFKGTTIGKNAALSLLFSGGGGDNCPLIIVWRPVISSNGSSP